MKLQTLEPRYHRRIFICSPFRPRDGTLEERLKDLHSNQEMARFVCRYAVSLGYMPLAPHLYFPQFLSDSDVDERETGIRFGLEWLCRCDELWVIGHRITEGMRREIGIAMKLGLPITQFTFYKASEKSLFPQKRWDRM